MMKIFKDGLKAKQEFQGRWDENYIKLVICISSRMIVGSLSKSFNSLEER